MARFEMTPQRLAGDTAYAQSCVERKKVEMRFAHSLRAGPDPQATGQVRLAIRTTRPDASLTIKTKVTLRNSDDPGCHSGQPVA